MTYLSFIDCVRIPYFALCNKRLCLQRLLKVAKEVALGMQYLSEVGYVHRVSYWIWVQRNETRKYLLSNDIGFQHSVDDNKGKFFVSVCSG